MGQEKHIDGTWFTSHHEYLNRKIMVKMKVGKGAKTHVFLPNSTLVDFTMRFKFANVDRILVRVINKIDINIKLMALWEYCDLANKSSKARLEYMITGANVSLDTVLNFLKTNSEKRKYYVTQ